MNTAYTNSSSNITSTNVTSTANTRASKTHMREQLYRIIEGLSESQTNLLLMQAQTLSVDDHRSEVRTSSIQSLSKRELEVLVLVASGYNRKSIGNTLGISVNTAARHIANIYSKLGISTVAEATCFAYSSNVIGGMHGGVEHRGGEFRM